MRAMLVVLSIAAAAVGASAERPKILCLHGGGQSPSSFKGDAGMRALEAALPQFEFVYAAGGYGASWSPLWIADPPNGKGEPTTDPDWAKDSVAALDEIVEREGPFFGILGYSQGSAFVPTYLSQAKMGVSFEVALCFCGYIPTTHLGLVDRILAESPFRGIPALVWMSSKDWIISNSMTQEQAGVFLSPRVVRSTQGGHAVPNESDPTFSQVVDFILNASSTSASVTTLD